MIRSTDYGESEGKTSESEATASSMCRRRCCLCLDWGPEYATPRGRVVDFLAIAGRGGNSRCCLWLHLISTRQTGGQQITRLQTKSTETKGDSSAQAVGGQARSAASEIEVMKGETNQNGRATGNGIQQRGRQETAGRLVGCEGRTVQSERKGAVSLARKGGLFSGLLTIAEPGLRCEPQAAMTPHTGSPSSSPSRQRTWSPLRLVPRSSRT